MSLVYTAACSTCGWEAEPGGDEVDKAAEKHIAGNKHTVVTTVRVKRDE